MKFLHIFDASGKHLITIKTNTPRQCARNWIRSAGIQDASWYAANAA